MEIYALRHGITDLNKKGIPNGQIDEPLAPEGLEQAKQATSLVPPNTKIIYVSPLLRARQTAEAVNLGRNLPISINDSIKELNMGSLAGNSWDTLEGGQGLRKLHQTLEFDYRPYGGESAVDFRNRILGFLEQIRYKHSTKSVLLVTHGVIIRMLTLLEQGKPLEKTENLSLHTFNLDRIFGVTG